MAASGIDASLLFRALRSRNFRLFFLGQGTSLIGTWMQQIAMSWLAYRLTNSAWLLGLVGFTGQLPLFLLAPVAGVLVDRWDKRRMLLATQSLSMALAFVLAVLTWTGAVTVHHLLVFSFLLGAVNAFDIPGRQSFVVEMVEEKESLANAIALNSSLFNLTRLVGPSIAGFIIAAAGEGTCFFLNGLSFVAVLAALLAMRLARRPPAARDARVWDGLREGVGYTFGSVPIRTILALLALVSFMGAPYAVLMPVFARDIFGGGPRELGFLMAAVGLGATSGALYLASRRTVRGLGRIIVMASALFAVGLMAFSQIRDLRIGLALLFMTGFGMMVHLAASNTILQTIVEDEKRGRVMSFYTVSVAGMAPFGSLAAGSLASRIGAPETLILGGASCLAGSVLFALGLPRLRRHIRPIYQEKGIIGEVAQGLQAAAQVATPPED